MFTGITIHIGKLKRIHNNTLTFSAPKKLCSKLITGTSIAIDGVCLTIVDKPLTMTFSVELMPETKRKTTLNRLGVGDMVNLELPATPKTFLSGHIVQGHIDGVGKITAIREDTNSHVLTIKTPPNLARFIVSKGSITVNGVSLTVINAKKTSFTVGIIPYTWSHTTFHTLRVGDTVNAEVDILAKYAKKKF